jgi:hypothetical protein
MRRALLAAVLTLSAPVIARADGLIDMSSVNQQASDLTDRAHNSVNKALEPDPKDKKGAKGKARPQKSSGLIDMSSVNEQANDVGDRAHHSVQGALAPEPKAKGNTKGKSPAKAHAKAKASKPPPAPAG